MPPVIVTPLMPGQRQPVKCESCEALDAVCVVTFADGRSFVVCGACCKDQP